MTHLNIPVDVSKLIHVNILLDAPGQPGRVCSCHDKGRIIFSAVAEQACAGCVDWGLAACACFSHHHELAGTAGFVNALADDPVNDRPGRNQLLLFGMKGGKHTCVLCQKRWSGALAASQCEYALRALDQTRAHRVRHHLPRKPQANPLRGVQPDHENRAATLPPKRCAVTDLTDCTTAVQSATEPKRNSQCK